MRFAAQERTGCGAMRAQFSAYLDGALSGVAMKSLQGHLDACSGCAGEFAGWRELQASLAGMGTAKAPADLQMRLMGAIAEERVRGSHLSWYGQARKAWAGWAASFAFRAAMGTTAALVLVGGLSFTLLGAPTPGGSER